MYVTESVPNGWTVKIKAEKRGTAYLKGKNDRRSFEPKNLAFGGPVWKILRIRDKIKKIRIATQL